MTNERIRRAIKELKMLDEAQQREKAVADRKKREDRMAEQMAEIRRRRTYLPPIAEVRPTIYGSITGSTEPSFDNEIEDDFLSSL